MALQPKINGKYLPNNTLIYPTELFKMICRESTREMRKTLLIEYYKKSDAHANVLRSIAELTWHPAVQWDLPEGAPPYTPASPHTAEAPRSLFKVVKDASRFLKGGGGYIHNMLKREHYYTQILESLSKPEAELFVAIKDKKVSELYPAIQFDLFAEVFPTWFPKELVDSVKPVEVDAVDLDAPVVELPNVEVPENMEGVSEESVEPPQKQSKPRGRKREIY